MLTKGFINFGLGREPNVDRSRVINYTPGVGICLRRLAQVDIVIGIASIEGIDHMYQNKNPTCIYVNGGFLPASLKYWQTSKQTVRRIRVESFHCKHRATLSTQYVSTDYPMTAIQTHSVGTS